MQPVPEFYGPFLQRLRKHKAITQAELAEKVDCDVTTIRRYENGWCTPSALGVLRLARVLEVDTLNFYQERPLKNFVSGTRIEIDGSNGGAEHSVPPLEASLTDRLSTVPQLYLGTRVRFKFRNVPKGFDGRWCGWQTLDVSHAKWLGLTPGATLYSSLNLFTDDQPDGLGHFEVFASGDRAAAVLDLENDVEVDVIGEWAHAVGLDWRSRASGDEQNTEYEERSGFVITQFVSDPPQPGVPI